MFELVVECLTNEKPLEAQQALATAMKLLSVEGKHPVEFSNGPTFPILRLNKILVKLLSTEKLTKQLIIRLSEFVAFDDFCFYVWKLLLKNLTPTKMNQPSGVFIQNYLELLNVIIRPPCEKVAENDEVEYLFLGFYN